MGANTGIRNPARGLIVFSDLDGTLLDHHSYDHAPALPTLERLRGAGIPLVLASSKTAAEMVPLRAELGFQHCPMICENGAGLIEAGGLGLSGDEEYHRLRLALDRLGADLRGAFEGFGDMTLARICDVTGLTEEAAERAAKRQFSEPGIWNGTEDGLQMFLAALDAVGLSARRGGRFVTLSFGKTKADQMSHILAQMQCDTVIALGDAPNDAEMLLAADYAIILPAAKGAAEPEIPEGSGPTRILRAQQPGPDGWNKTLGALLTQLGVAEEEGDQRG